MAPTHRATHLRAFEVIVLLPAVLEGLVFSTLLSSVAEMAGGLLPTFCATYPTPTTPFSKEVGVVAAGCFFLFFFLTRSSVDACVVSRARSNARVLDISNPVVSEKTDSKRMTERKVFLRGQERNLRRKEKESGLCGEEGPGGGGGGVSMPMPYIFCR